MVFDSANLVGGITGGSSGLVNIIIYSVVGMVVLVILGLAFIWWYTKKNWNLDVEFKLTRNDGRITNAEWGTGCYDAKKGVVFVKRPTDKFRYKNPWAKGIAVKIFDIRRYIQGDRIITMLQVGPEDYRPVLNDSWTSYVYEKQREDGTIVEIKESILNIKVDSGLNKAWKSSWDAAAKNAYSIMSFFQTFQTPIAIGIVVICCFVGFAILWTKVH